ncbi:MAG: bifunctional precorrin-2 dehydrogenase/sirohydrochlorin ferrochelatase [Chloroflexi bacterium]|nr:bifunctional precorrin-2 dehydrogenase/sirohydrochlorin ferrochelatase [Chloroflexota bacterium]
MKKREPASPYYPIFLNIRGKKCLVVGGGKVALRKVQTLLEHGADVEVVSPALCPELNRLAKDGTIRAQQRSYKAKDLHDALIAVAATDDSKINEGIAAKARRRGILINVVDDPKNSDFIVPSYLRRGDIIVAVSTSGRSPSLARKIRTELEKDFKAEYAQLALIADEVRSELKQQGITVDSDAWQEVLNLNSVAELLRQGENQEAKEVIIRKLKAR